MSRPSERRWFSGSHQVTTLQIRKVEVRPAFLACSQERLNFDISTPPDVVLPLKQGPPGANKTQSLGGARVLGSVSTVGPRYGAMARAIGG
jgi:hypothetical protein